MGFLPSWFAGTMKEIEAKIQNDIAVTVNLLVIKLLFILLLSKRG